MARKASKGKGGTRAPLSLRDRYGAELEAIRKRYVAEVRDAAQRLFQAGADLQEVARLEAKAQRRERESNYQIMAREFRRDVSKAKKKGLLPKGKAISPIGKGASRVLGVLDRIDEVLRGTKKAQKVSPEVGKKLKREGAQVVRNRVILDSDFSVNKRGAIVQAIPGFTQQRQVYFDGDEDPEDIIDALFDAMTEEQRVVITVGNNHSLIYTRRDRETFKKVFFAYQDRWTPYVTLGVFPNQAEAFRELNRRADVIKRNKGANLTAARKARKQAERARKRAERKAGPGKYLHSGKQGPQGQPRGRK